MKRTIASRKLRVHRTTLRALTHTGLSRAAGAGRVDSILAAACDPDPKPDPSPSILVSICWECPTDPTDWSMWLTLCCADTNGCPAYG